MFFVREAAVSLFILDFALRQQMDCVRRLENNIKNYFFFFFDGLKKKKGNRTVLHIEAVSKLSRDAEKKKVF